MKKSLLSSILVTIFAIIMISDVYAAIITTTAPYSGDYLLAINTSTDTTTTQYSGSLSTATENNKLFSTDTASIATTDPDVMDVKDDNGKKIYQVDARNKLAKMKAPLQMTTKSTTNFMFDSVYQATYSIGSKKIFYTANMLLEKYETEYFTLIYSGTKCEVWVESDSQVSLNSSNVYNLGKEYDNNISPNMATNFGDKYDRDGNGKTAIMLYDIQEGFDGGANNSYIAGFFDGNDLVGNNNNADVLHIDTYPGMGTNKSAPNVSDAYSTIVHENQHLINFSYSYTHSFDNMPLFLNEGLSMAAEDMFYGTLSERIDYYNTSTYIRDGQSLFDWESGDTLSNYSLAYLFVQYLKSQTKSFTGGGTAMYKTFIQSSNRTSTVIQDIMRKFYYNITLDDIQKNFRMATFLKETTGAQGFMGESGFNAVSPLLYTGNGANLRGGGAIVKKISGSYTPSGYGSNIKFVGFKYNKAEAPTANVASGTVAYGSSVSLNCLSSGATIRYTRDGTTPTMTTGNIYYGPIVITENVTIKAIAYGTKITNSDVVMFTYSSAPLDALLQKNFGGSSSDYYNCVTAVNDGVVAVGYSDSFGSGDWANVTGKGGIDAIIVKYDISGTIAWKNNFGGSGSDYYNSVIAVNDGFVAIGYSTSFGNGDWTNVTGKGSSDAIIVKYDTSGNIVWKKNFGGLNNDQYSSVTSVNDGFIAVGYSYSSSFSNGDWANVSSKGYNDAIIVKYDTSGNVVWKKNFGGSYNDYYQSLTYVNDGIIAVGYCGSTSFGNGDLLGITSKGGSYDAVIVKYDLSGNIVWKKNFGGASSDYYNCVATLNDGVVVVGYSDSIGSGDFSGVVGKGSNDAIIVKYDSNGNVMWKKNFGGSGNDYYQSLTTANNEITAVGYSESFGNGDWANVVGNGNIDATIVKYDSNGNIEWKNNFGGSDNDYYKSITTINDEVIAVGYSGIYSFSNGDFLNVTGKGNSDAILVKYKNQNIPSIKPLFDNFYGIYSGATKLDSFPQLYGTYTVKAQYTNTTGKIINTSFAVVVKSNNKLLKTYILPSQNVPIDGIVNISKNITLPSATLYADLTVEIIALDSLKTLTPLSNGIIIER